jgi:hypothetical protein
MPADTGKYRGRILSAFDAGQQEVIDKRNRAQWKITCKTFAHTGGESPKP